MASGTNYESALPAALTKDIIEHHLISRLFRCLRALPPALIHVPPLQLVTALLEELERDWHLDEERLRERLVARAACTAAIKAGDPLSLETMQDLVDDLLMVWSPATCPHGRPAFVTLSVQELERRFLRR